MELGDLRSLIHLLREQGVTHYKDESLELKLGAVPSQGAEETVPRHKSLDEVEKVLGGLDPKYGELFHCRAKGPNQ